MGATMRTVVGQVPTSATDVFTATSSQGSSVSLIQITNTIGSNRTISVTVTTDGSTYRNLAASIVIPPSTAVGILTGTLNLATNSKIRLICSTSGAALGDCDYAISSLDYS